jgi:hypothetical protein
MKKLIAVLALVVAGTVSGCAMLDELGRNDVVRNDSGMSFSCKEAMQTYDELKPGQKLTIQKIVFGIKLGDWSKEDIDFVGRSIYRCVWEIRVNDDIRNNTLVKFYYATYNSIQAEKEWLAKSKEEERVRKEQEDRNAKCRARNKASYDLYVAQHNLISAWNNFVPWKSQLDRQQRISEMSGVVDLQHQRMLGEMVYSYSEAVDKRFSDYKAAGGKARSPQDAVSKPLPYPCQGI